jgi:hypothetical protein
VSCPGEFSLPPVPEAGDIAVLVLMVGSSAGAAGVEGGVGAASICGIAVADVLQVSATTCWAALACCQDAKTFSTKHPRHQARHSLHACRAACDKLGTWAEGHKTSCALVHWCIGA